MVYKLNEDSNLYFIYLTYFTITQVFVLEKYANINISTYNQVSFKKV